MKTIRFETQRFYDNAQVLEIAMPEDADRYDSWDLVEVRFDDAARAISGTVKVMALELNQFAVGPAVMREYDAGRYTLA